MKILDRGTTKKQFILIAAGMLVFSIPYPMPSEKVEKVTFIAIADPHLSMISNNKHMKIYERSGQIMEETIAEINKMDDIDFVILLGDLFRDLEVWNLDRMRELLDELLVPYYVIFGNHDIPPVRSEAVYGDDVVMGYAASKISFVMTFQGHGFNGHEYWWSANPTDWLHLVGMDATKIGTWGGHVPKRELKWLENILSAQTDKKVTIILAHHNLTTHGPDDEYPEWYNFRADNDRDVRKILEPHTNVKLVITGHHHIADIRTVNGIHYVTCPSLLTYPCKYTKFTVTRTMVQVETISIKNDEILDEALAGIRMKDADKPPSTAGQPDEKRVQAQIDLALDIGGLLEDNNETLKLR